jgi:hypothetical protein
MKHILIIPLFICIRLVILFLYIVSYLDKKTQNKIKGTCSWESIKEHYKYFSKQIKWKRNKQQ